MQIQNLDVQVVKVSNNKYLITYDVAGRIALFDNQALVIDQVYVTGYPNKNPDLDYFRVIDIMPMTKYMGKKNSEQDFESFRFKNEYKIQSAYPGLGQNERVKVVCGNKEQIIELK